MSSEHDPAYRFGYAADELERLGRQHRVWSAANRALLDRAGFGPGMTVVDLGCGPGYTTLDLARRVGPTGQVIAVDRDGSRSLRVLEARCAEEAIDWVGAREADLAQFDLPLESVDGIYGRWVLMYLPLASVESLVARMVGWLRPGGIFASAEFCNYRHMHVHPPIDALSEVADALYRAVEGDRGCCPDVGNLLPGFARRAGLEVDIHVVTTAARCGTDGWRWPDDLFRLHLPGLVEEGWLAERTRRAFLADWEARCADPDAIFFGTPMMETGGVKPGVGRAS
jgi:SAM-dependent methyltransferase